MNGFPRSYSPNGMPPVIGLVEIATKYIPMLLLWDLKETSQISHITTLMGN